MDKTTKVLNKFIIIKRFSKNGVGFNMCMARNLADNKKPAGVKDRPDPHSIYQDFIGPPDRRSNLRPYVRAIPKNETPLAQRFREKQDEVQEWNQDFWSRHNQRFYDEKEDFVQAHKVAKAEDISADRMSVFYKKFLDKNKKLHFYYNMSWYLKNFDLLVMSGQVNAQKIWNKLRNSK